MALKFSPNPYQNLVANPTPRKLNAAFKPYAVELGKLVYAWNRLHEQLAKLFVLTTGIADYKIASGIWYSTPSDLSQRKMLRAVIEVKKFNRPEAKEEILWVLHTIDNKLSKNRNTAIHAPFSLVVDAKGIALHSDLFSENPNAKSLWQKNLKDEFIWYRRMCDVLNWYVYDMHHEMASGGRHPWPSRPQLPTLGQMKDPARKTRPRSRKAKGPIQLKSVPR